MAYDPIVGIINGQNAVGGLLDQGQRVQAHISDLFDQHARMRAGEALKSGDTRGAAGLLASRGMLEDATTLQDRATSQDDAEKKARLEWMGHAVDALSQINTPDGQEDLQGREQAFKSLVPTLKAMGQLSDEQLSQIQAGHFTNQSLQAFKAMLGQFSTLSIHATAEGDIIGVDPKTGQTRVLHHSAPKGVVVGSDLVDPVTGKPLYIGARNVTQGAISTPGHPADGEAPDAPAEPSTTVGEGGFDAIYGGFVKPQEGGYTAHDGNGGPANFGINQEANPDVDVKNLTPEQAKKLYYDRYWLPSGAADLPPALQAMQFDTAVNMGVGAAHDLLQRSGGDPAKYLALREERYRAIAAHNPAKAPSLPVWLHRNEALKGYALGQGAAKPTRGAPVVSDGVAYPPGTIVNPKAAEEGDVPLDPSTVEMMAGMYLGTRTLPSLGGGKYAAANKVAILNAANRQAKALGLDANDIIAGTVSIKAAGKALEKITATRAQVEANENAVIANADFAMTLAPKGAGTMGSPVINQWQQHIKDRAFGDPDVKAFDSALHTVADEYARVMTATTGAGGVSSDSARQEAYRRLSLSSTPQQLAAVIAAMKTEMANRVRSFKAQEEGLSAHIRAGYGEQGAPAAAPPSARQGFPRPSDAQTQLLRSKPNLWKQFDEKFGPGAASHVLKPEKYGPL